MRVGVHDTGAEKRAPRRARQQPRDAELLVAGVLVEAPDELLERLALEELERQHALGRQLVEDARHLQVGEAAE